MTAVDPATRDAAAEAMRAQLRRAVEDSARTPAHLKRYMPAIADRIVAARRTGGEG